MKLRLFRGLRDALLGKVTDGSLGLALDDTARPKLLVGTPAGPAPLSVAQVDVDGLVAALLDRVTPAALAAALVGKADLVGGKIPDAQLPPLAITDVFPVESQAEMLALTAQSGDVASYPETLSNGLLVRRHWILKQAPSSVLDNWLELDPTTEGVTSFNGRMGLVMPAAGDYSLAQITGLVDALAGKSATGHGHAISEVTGLQAALASAVGWRRWEADVPPASPSAMDDEFTTESSTPNARWTCINFAGMTAYDVSLTAPGHLYMAQANRGRTMGAVLQPLPAGDFAIYTKVRHYSQSSSPDSSAGMVLSSSATAGSGTQYVLCTSSYQNVQEYVQIYSYTGFNTFGTQLLTTLNDGIRYLGIKRVGSAWSFGFSADGNCWSWYAYTPAVTPTHIGLQALCYQTQRSDDYFDFFRVLTPSAKLGAWVG